MAETKKPKRTKKVTEIEEAKVTIEVEATDDEVKESEEVKETPEEVEDSEETEEVKEATEEVEESKEVEEVKEPEIENFENEGSWFSWSKVFLFIVIAAVTGFIIVGAYLFFFEGYNFSLTKEDSVKESIDVEEELSPTPTPETSDKSAFNITVLNGSGIAGEAANVQELLEGEGFSVNDIGNAETADYTNTQILYSEDVNEQFLDELEAALETRGPVEMEEADSDQTEDVVVIVGSSLADDTEEEATPTPELE